MKIVAKHGYPFVAHRYRKRKLLAAGFIFFVCMLYFLSSFVWLIDVQGNSRLRTDDILSFCRDEEKLTVGVFKHMVDTRAVKNSLMDHYPDIAWVDVHIKGTRATIKLAETIPSQEMIDRNTPCDIVAKKDGLISHMVTAAGTPLVKQNDVVRKDDLLVSGEVVVTDGEVEGFREYVHAYSEIWAKMYTEIRLSVPFRYTEKKYTGNQQKRYSVILMGRRINLLNSNTNYVNYDRITSRKQIGIGEDYPLPLILVTEWYREFVPEERTRSVAHAKELAEKMVSGRIIREFDFGADIIDKICEYNQNADSLDVKAVITTNERIDEQREIALE